MPERLQLSRKKGYRLPKNAVVVSRPTRWGNPWSIKAAIESKLFKPECCAQICVDEYDAWLTKKDSPYDEHLGFWHKLKGRRDWILEHIEDLRGKDLACWCSSDQPCHADILLRLANNQFQPTGGILPVNENLLTSEGDPALEVRPGPPPVG